jgi:hypothetical protein
VLLCTRVILNFVMVEDEIVHESVGKVNETIPLHINIILSHSLSNVENVHQQCDNDVFDEVHFQTSTLLWKPHNKTFICWSFLAKNNNLLVDLVNPQMLCCTICKTQQVHGNILN